jgi:hypothetical protein
MAGVLLRTAGGTLLYVAFLWFVRIDDWRVAGMMLTFPMLNGMALVSARQNADVSGQSMVPIVTLNGAMCFLFALALAWSETARAHPLAITLVATVLWVCVYIIMEKRNAVVPVRAWLAYTVAWAVAAIALTVWLWPACSATAASSPIRAGGLAGVLESWVRILLFAGSLLLVFGVAHFYRNAHAAVGRLGALPVVPLFGLYTVGSVLAADSAAATKLDTMRSMVAIGWLFALIFAVALAAYVASSSRGKPTTFIHLAALLGGWALCLGAIAASARVAPMIAGCAAQ